MHRLTLNRVSLAFSLTPRTGLLVKEGNKERAMLRSNEADMQPIRVRVEGGETVFIPGSSLKGAFRAAAERHLRGLASGPEVVNRFACDPLDMRGSPCHTASRRRVRGQVERDPTTAELHARQCLACRTFGSQQIAGRIRFADALPPEGAERRRANRLDTRAGVAIDRRTGAANAKKLFEADVVSGGAFQVSLEMHNVQLWQVGLLATVLDEVDLGLVRVGGGGTRGLGHMSVQLGSLSWWQRGRESAPSGVGRLMPAGSGPDFAYGWLADGTMSGLALPEPTRALGGQTWRWEGAAAEEVLRKVEDAGWEALAAWTAPEVP